jgi:hypothetical protein
MRGKLTVTQNIDKTNLIALLIIVLTIAICGIFFIFSEHFLNLF